MKKQIILFLICITLNLSTSNVNGSENASNPLAVVNNTDVRLKYFDVDGSDRFDIYLDGAYMLTPRLKLKYELHYWDTDVTGASERDFESFHAKPIYFPQTLTGKLGAWKYKAAIGAELIIDFENEAKGIGTGSDQIAPFFGLSLNQGNTVLVPLLQHFMDFNGADVSKTTIRLIALQMLPKQFWSKFDIKIPVDWENDNAVPASAEIQLGKMFTSWFGTYVDGALGIGSDKSYDWGVGMGLRFKY